MAGVVQIRHKPFYTSLETKPIIVCSGFHSTVNLSQVARLCSSFGFSDIISTGGAGRKLDKVTHICGSLHIYSIRDVAGCFDIFGFVSTKGDSLDHR